MSVLHLKFIVDESIESVIDNLLKQNLEMSKLLVEVVGSTQGWPAVNQQTCSKIYQLYIKLAQAKPDANVQINIENLKGRQASKSLGAEKIHLEEAYKPDSKNLLQVFRNVVLGGTFDRLHVGHKILLTEAVMRCQNKLTVGVTDESMIKNKKLWELIEPVEQRISNVLDFLQYIDGGLQYEVVPISDMFGPTRTDPDLDLLVVSEETAKGGLKVNEERLGRGLQPLALHTVNLVEAETTGEADEKKISSSNKRLKLLGTRLRHPEPKPNLANRPYLIGLTGGIASGKSNVGRNLLELGAGLVDCDKVAHTLYRQGTPTYKTLIELFGPNVIASDGEVNRRALGDIVFNSKEQMEKLNRLLWPAIIDASLEQANKLYSEEGKQVVVLEAAVLLRAGWLHSVHEVWTCIIPPAEAIDRVVKRNGISVSAAEARLAAQPTNSEQVAIANVVFCTLYSYDYTKAQVKTAWKILQDHLTRPATKL